MTQSWRTQSSCAFDADSGPSSIDRACTAPWPLRSWGTDPWFKGCMEETQILMRQIFRRKTGYHAAFGFGLRRDRASY